MYIVAIGWLYVTLLISLTESSIFAGILSFVFYGLAPTALLLWLTGSSARRKKRADADAGQEKGGKTGRSKNAAPQRATSNP